MASELLEFDDDEDGNEESNTGSKRNTPPVTVSSLEKGANLPPSKFKPDPSKSAN